MDKIEEIIAKSLNAYAHDRQLSIYGMLRAALREMAAYSYRDAAKRLRTSIIAGRTETANLLDRLAESVENGGR